MEPKIKSGSVDDIGDMECKREKEDRLIMEDPIDAQIDNELADYMRDHFYRNKGE